MKSPTVINWRLTATSLSQLLLRHAVGVIWLHKPSVTGYRNVLQQWQPLSILNSTDPEQVILYVWGTLSWHELSHTAAAATTTTAVAATTTTQRQLLSILHLTSCWPIQSKWSCMCEGLCHDTSCRTQQQQQQRQHNDNTTTAAQYPPLDILSTNPEQVILYVWGTLSWHGTSPTAAAATVKTTTTTQQDNVKRTQESICYLSFVQQM